TRKTLSEQLTKLEPFMSALRRRVTVALSFAQAQGNGLVEDDGKENSEFQRVLAAVGPEMTTAHDIASELNAFISLAQNRGNHSKPWHVDQALKEIAGRLEPSIAGIQERLQKFAYPFPHPRSPLTV